MNLKERDRFDHYQICSHIAQGSTCDIYQAFDVLTGHKVALKIPLRSAALDVGRFEQFLREIEALSCLNHPAIQHYVESGRSENTPFLVTNWIEGKSLRSLIKEHNSFSSEYAINLICKIALGLAYCHQEDVIHCDLKPENILLIDGDWPVLIDFGLAMTKSRPALLKGAGTPNYMAPEQIERETGDKRIDIYALGTMLFEMLTGEVPFIDKDPNEVMNMHLYAAVPRLDYINQNVSIQMATVVARCLQQNPEKRYADVHDLIYDLENLEWVDTSEIENLTSTPPQKSFLTTQFGQVLILLTLTVIGITLLTIVAVALKH